MVHGHRDGLDEGRLDQCNAMRFKTYFVLLLESIGAKHRKYN